VRHVVATQAACACCSRCSRAAEAVGMRWLATRLRLLPAAMSRLAPAVPRVASAARCRPACIAHTAR
jgi:hypothetical protein